MKTWRTFLFDARLAISWAISKNDQASVACIHLHTKMNVKSMDLIINWNILCDHISLVLALICYF